MNGVRASSALLWKSTGTLQQTLVSGIERVGKTLHSGALSRLKLLPAMAGEGRFFVCGDHQSKIPASIDFIRETVLCTRLGNNGETVRTVEHLLSALEASGVDNCQIEIAGADEVPILDGSAREWLEAIKQVGLCVATDYEGNSIEKSVPFLIEPVHVRRNDSYIAAFPSPKTRVTYGINFPQVPAIGCQWCSFFPMEYSVYESEVASARTFCIYEEIEKLHSAGLIQGGSVENAMVCSASKGWLNPPLRYPDEPCRHKILDLVGDLSLLAKNGNQGLPVAHIVCYKGGHSLHAEFARCLVGLHQNETAT